MEPDFGGAGSGDAAVTNVFRSRESTLINCFLMLNAFHVEDFLLVAAVTVASFLAIRPSSGAGEMKFAGSDGGGMSSDSVASKAGEGDRDEFLLPSNGLLVGVFWGLAEISVN